MAAQIELFEADPDELFRARAADLADLRDRVLAALDGAAAACCRCRLAPSCSTATSRRPVSSPSIPRR